MYRPGGARACNGGVRERSEEPELELLVGESTGDRPVSERSVRLTDRDFDPFYRAEYPKVVRLLVGLTGRRPVAEEVAQEVLLSAYKRWHRVQAMDRPDLWLRRVAVNRAISAHRRVVAEVAAVARLRASGGEVAAPADPDEHLWGQVRSLPARQAAALVLWAVEGLTFDEVGEVLGCSGETARTHLRRARQRLATNLEGDRR